MKANRSRIAAATTLLLLALAAGTAQAHHAQGHDEPAPAATPVLGHLVFPTSSKSPTAQAAFEQGMLLWHVFEYADAAKEFQRAQQLDPGFALAYWGEALTYTHPVWNQQDLTAGRAALAKLGPTPEARAAKAGSERERDLLRFTEILYGEGDKPARDLQVLDWAEQLAKRYPDDDEVQLLLSLSLLGADEGVRNVPRFLRAAEIAKAVYRHNPQHPGAAHFWIHGLDDPEHAEGALEAAQALSKIAPGAGHSQHMTSHIFIALGRWDDVVASNVAAIGVVNAGLAAKGQPAAACGHYSEWLQYSRFQLGRDREAFDMVTACQQSAQAALAWMRAHPGEAYLGNKDIDAVQRRLNGSLSSMRAVAVFESPQYRKAAGALDLGGVDKDEGQALFAAGLAEAWNDEPARARTQLAALRKLAAAPAEPGDNGTWAKYLGLMAQMLEGVVLQREGRGKAGLAQVEAAAASFDAMPFDFGPPPLGLPPRELLGQMLLEAGKKAEAAKQFELALKTAPNRRLSLQGRERALAK